VATRTNVLYRSEPITRIKHAKTRRQQIMQTVIIRLNLLKSFVSALSIISEIVRSVSHKPHRFDFLKKASNLALSVSDNRTQQQQLLLVVTSLVR